MEFKIALDAGLTQSELAHVFGVTRTTVNLWVNGKMKPHRYNVDNVRQRMELLQTAISKKLIPPRVGKRTPRHEAITAVLKMLERGANAVPV